ncbi:hypothetical protein H5410_007174 [Solanum commersonii]|uniref:Uncharacterized protein n=1 Tax=Solanum commersonii TaxID=4109 RepID=A0A9J6ACC0_SOLCO|nr:hypothetical protein H5410_007174 [Solanum commersonii]
MKPQRTCKPRKPHIKGREIKSMIFDHMEWERRNSRGSNKMDPTSTSSHRNTVHFNSCEDGEDVVDCEPIVGYLHRGMEKIAENREVGII